MMLADESTNVDAKNQFATPGAWYEVMSNGPYPKWVTAHTYNEIFVVLSAINAWSRGGPDGEAAYQQYFESRALRGSVDTDGHWSWSVSFGGDSLEPADDPANYAEFRGPNIGDLPQPVSIKPEYAYLDPGHGEGEERIVLRGAVVPLPADYDERGLSGLHMVVEGEVHEVSMDFVVDNLPRNIDWLTKLDEHLARQRASAQR